VKKQIVNAGSFQYQSSAKRKVLVDFLTNIPNNIQWHRYAHNRLLMLARIGCTGCLEAQDYVSEAKVIILESVTVTGAFTPNPRFSITKNGKTFSMSRNLLNNYFYLLMKWKISHEFREGQKTIPLPQWDVDDDGDINPEDDVLMCRKKPDSDFIVPFNDPFDDNILSSEFLENFCNSLDDKDPLVLAVLEERLNGVPNRLIARKYKISVRRVEIIRKTLKRRLYLSPIGKV